MLIFLLIYLSFFFASQIVKCTVIGISYRRKDYLYYSFLTNIITSSIFFLLITLIFWISATIMRTDNQISSIFHRIFWLLIFGVPEITINIMETYIYIKLLKLSKQQSVATAIIINIITFIVFIIFIILMPIFYKLLITN